MFKKGSFEIGATIYPVAIKVNLSVSICLNSVFHFSLLRGAVPNLYLSASWNLCQYDPKFGDAFWNSSKYSMVSYLLRMMTSWALVCNVWYLPAMHQQVCIACAKALECMHIHSTAYITHHGWLILLFFFYS